MVPADRPYPARTIRGHLAAGRSAQSSRSRRTRSATACAGAAAKVGARPASMRMPTSSATPSNGASTAPGSGAAWPHEATNSRSPARPHSTSPPSSSGHGADQGDRTWGLTAASTAAHGRRPAGWQGRHNPPSGQMDACPRTAQGRAPDAASAGRPTRSRPGIRQAHPDAQTGARSLPGSGTPARRAPSSCSSRSRREPAGLRARRGPPQTLTRGAACPYDPGPPTGHGTATICPGQDAYGDDPALPGRWVRTHAHLAGWRVVSPFHPARHRPHTTLHAAVRP